MKAIILAAGYGSRMYPLAQDIPKCLLTIKGETLLARQLRILGNCEISDITIVTGFRSEKIVELYGEEVSIRYNPHYEITGNIFSLWIVRDLLVDDVIIINSDVVFTEEPIRSLLDNDNLYCVVVDNRSVLDTESQNVKIVDENIIAIGKFVAISEAYGEAIGINKVRKAGLDIFKESMFECVKKNSNNYSPFIFQAIAERNYPVNYILIDTPWVEIDTKADYEDAKRGSWR